MPNVSIRVECRFWLPTVLRVTCSWAISSWHLSTYSHPLSTALLRLRVRYIALADRNRIRFNEKSYAVRDLLAFSPALKWDTRFKRRSTIIIRFGG